ncbi:MAG: hypothetical protein IJX77_03260 [Ruminococcus sp.]|nr:hypothetical protein [Ruminococcus sp.]
MKKILCIIALQLLLCGCENTEKTFTSENVESATVTTTEISPEETEVFVDEDTSIIYETLDAFKSSDFYNTMKSEGYPPYLLEFDEERYDLGKIISNTSSYDYILYDNEAEVNIVYSIMYDTYIEEMSDLQAAFPYSDNILTTAECGGEIYDVYLITSPYNVDSEKNSTFTDYDLAFLPDFRYEAYLTINGITTTDEILSYFDDFVLVPDESQAAQ